MDGMFLGVMTFVGFSVIYSRLHPKVKIFAQNHPVFTDVVCAVFFYQVMGMTITAHFAVATMSMLSMAGLHIAKNKDDFAFLFDWIDRAKSKVNELLQQLKDSSVKMNAAFKAEQLAKAQTMLVAQ
jgi:hypothetical protein